MDKKDLLKSAGIRQTSIKLEGKLLKRLEEYIKVLKKKNQPHKTKQGFISEAIEEKFRSLPQRNNNKDNERSKCISLYLHENEYKRLEQQVEISRKTIGYGSKKQWIINAIEEKLQRDENN